MRGTLAGGTAAMACAFAMAPAAAQPAAMRAPLWQGIQRVTVEFALSGSDPTFADRLRQSALAAAHARSAWPVSEDAGDATRDTAILTIKYDGATLAGQVQRAVAVDDSEGARIVPPVALAADATPAAIDSAMTALVARALPRTTDSTRNDIRIHREN